MESLANKYRPHTFEEVVGQEYIIKILRRQVELNQFKNCYMFCGPSGCGKTTLARIFANEINCGDGFPIEIDAASNNGVDNVKQIVAEASERSVHSKYKIYIIDECHSLTQQAWQAFLKCIEEPPTYTIFMFATTDPQKVPDTIMNRCMRFNIQKIPSEQIVERLNKICEQEGFKNYETTTDLISKMCKNQCRDAISMLDKVAAYGDEFDYEVSSNILGGVSYDIYFQLINALIDGDQGSVFKIVDNLNRSGIDFKVFTDKFLEFNLDLLGFLLLGITRTVPVKYAEMVKKATNLSEADNYYDYVCDRLIALKNSLKGSVDTMTTVQVALLQICRLV